MINSDPNSREFKQSLDRYITSEPDWNDGIKCPDCGAMSGYRDEEHSTNMVVYLSCDNCGYGWTEVIDNQYDDTPTMYVPELDDEGDK